MKKLASLEITKEERAEFETKLNTIKGKLNQEDLQWAIQHANAPEGERRMPHYMMKAKKVLKQLILEPSISPDERKSLEEKLRELKAKMSPELISALDSKVIEFKEKLAKREKKRNEKLKEKIASVIQD
jgi:membrane-associated HD superfamily phosphohydrolase